MNTDILLYIGALTDTLPLDIFPNIKQFIYVDQMPADKCNHFPPPCHGNRFRDENFFLNSLIKNITNQGHKIDKIQKFINKLIISFDNDRILTYFYNVVFPSETNAIFDELNQATILFICGYTPKINDLCTFTNIKQKYMTKICADMTPYTPSFHDTCIIFAEYELHEDGYNILMPSRSSICFWTPIGKPNNMNILELLLKTCQEYEYDYYSESDSSEFQ